MKSTWYNISTSIFDRDLHLAGESQFKSILPDILYMILTSSLGVMMENAEMYRSTWPTMSKHKMKYEISFHITMKRDKVTFLERLVFLFFNMCWFYYFFLV